MYSLESKKRKFDRLLQSINKSQTSLALPKEQEAPKKRRVTAPPSLSKRSRLHGTTITSIVNVNRARPNYLPQSQEAFLERLHTFAPVQKWHVSSTEEINAAEWAKRGWSCVGDDLVACSGGCNEQLLVKLDNNMDDDEAQEDPEKTVLEDVDGFSDHEDNEKPRYTALLSPSIELPPASAVRLTTTSSPSTEALTNTISLTRTDFDLFPPQEAAPSTDDSSSSPVTDPQPLWPSSSLPTHHAALTLAALGWEVPSTTPSDSSSAISILHCTSCFRRLGLWLYTSGTLSHLDAIDEHLEYCPWRSPAAQASESKSDSGMAGWQILGRTMEREILRKRRGKPAPTLRNRNAEAEGPNGRSKDTNRDNAAKGEVEEPGEEQEEESNEEREKKMKALMRKIRELKKPFDMKGLLKKKG
ncbi:MAG: hypothetical protein Q9160_004034 [Pyrenula sp. 1 TL-2023]